MFLLGPSEVPIEDNMIEMVQDVLPMTMLDGCREIKLAD